VVEHCVGPLGVGTLVVKPVRHVTSIADLDAAESAELGPLLARVGAAVRQAVACEQIYVCLWSHAGRVPVHIHFVVQPARTEDLDAHDAVGPALQMAMFGAGVPPEVAAVEAICDRYRALLRAGPVL
jgi:diadenosine tetraphosphate (Ap4A) HIT family hydrolase